MKLGLVSQHTGTLHVVSDSTGRTVCGRRAWSVTECAENDKSRVDCKSCVRIHFGRELYVEVTEAVVSSTSEECRYDHEDEDECDGECFSLDGDVRYIEDPSTEIHSFADQDDEPSPLEWATAVIDDEVARNSSDFLEASAYPLPIQVDEHVWVSGRYTAPDTGYETEYSVRLTGDWTPRERGIVFRSIMNLKSI